MVSSSAIRDKASLVEGHAFRLPVYGYPVRCLDPGCDGHGIFRRRAIG